MPDLDVNTVNNLTNPGATGASGAAQNNALSALGGGGQVDVSQDTFLKLLVTQLQNQDPLEPQQNSEFVAQLAQFQTLEGQLESNETLARLAATQESQLVLSGLSQAASLVGAEVAWHDPYNGAIKSGIVDQITVENGVTTAHVGDYSVPIGLLDSVRRQGYGTAAASTASGSAAGSSASATAGSSASATAPVEENFVVPGPLGTTMNLPASSPAVRTLLSQVGAVSAG